MSYMLTSFTTASGCRVHVFVLDDVLTRKQLELQEHTFKNMSVGGRLTRCKDADETHFLQACAAARRTRFRDWHCGTVSDGDERGVWVVNARICALGTK